MDKCLDKLNQLDRIELLIKSKIIVDNAFDRSFFDFIKFGIISILVLLSKSFFLFFGLIFLWFYFYNKQKKLSQEAIKDLEDLKSSFFKLEPRRKR